MKDTCYIYTLTDPRDNTVRYVGRTQRDIKKRLTDHMADMSGSIKKVQWLTELRQASLRADITVVEELAVSQYSALAAEREAYWIYTYLEQGATLLNSLKVVRYHS